MESLELSDFRKLLFETKGPCVSIYVDTINRFGGPTEQLASLLTKATEALVAHDPATDVRALLRPIETLLEEKGERLVSGSGIGIFVSPTTQCFVSFPRAPRERVVVADSFHLKPLMRALATAVETYAAVALTIGGVQCFEGDACGARLVRKIPFGSAVRGRTAVRPLMIRVDRAVRAWIGRSRRPLILAGPAYLRAIYREVNTYPYLIADGFAVDMAVRAETIHTRATSVLTSAIERSLTQDLSELRDSLDDPNVTFDVRTAKDWVARGLVAKIFVAEDATVTAISGDCLLDDMAEDVLRKGGRVVCLPRSGFPEMGVVAAIKGSDNRRQNIPPEISQR